MQLPCGGRRWAPVLAGLAVLPLTGCSLDPAGDRPAAAPPSPALPSASASCDDRTGDGANGLDLTRVTLTGSPGGLQVRFQLAAPLPHRDGEALWVSLWTAGGAAVRTLTVRWKDAAVGDYSYDVTTAAVQWQPTATVDDDTVTATFRPDVVAGLGAAWRWTAAAGTTDGGPLDDCPQRADPDDAPDPLPFPAPTPR